MCYETLDCILTLLFFITSFLLLCEVIKIRMTSDTPVIISEQANMLWFFATRQPIVIWSALTKSPFFLDIKGHVLTSEVFVQLDAAKVHIKRPSIFFQSHYMKLH